MRMKLLPEIALILCLFIIGCHSRSSKSIDKVSLSPNEARAVCLASPNDGSPIGQAIREHQNRARRLSGKPDEWILVGKGWVRKARRSADPGFYVNVEACAQAALHTAPENLAALELHSLSLMNDHRFAEASHTAHLILAKDSKNRIALGTLSDAELEMGHFEDGADAAQKMMNLRPDMASYSRASYLRWLQGDRDTAKKFIRFALNGRDAQDAEPTAWTLVQAGMMFWNEGDYDGADAVFKEAENWVEDYPAALVGRARVALSRQRPQAAIPFLEQAYAAAPLVETAWLLGDAKEMSGDHEGALKSYDNVVAQGRRTDPLTLALFYATKNRDHDESLKLIETELKNRAGIYIEDAYAWSLYRAGRIAEARQASDRATRLGTLDARLLYHAGAIHLASGDPAGSDLVRKALSLNPRFDATGAVEAAKLVANHAK